MQPNETGNRVLTLTIGAILVAGIGIAGYFVWQEYMPLGLRGTPAAPPQATAPVAPPEPAAVPAEPAIQFPIEAAGQTEPAALPELAKSDSFMTDLLGELINRKDQLTFLQLDGFARRVVATVDNLARPHSAPMLWPVLPTPGRFTTGPGAGSAVTIGPQNAPRYTPFVRFVESIDSARAVALYARSYPLFQQAYEELGYPRRYFNDRLVAVIDHLIATPTLVGAPAVRLTEIKGPMQAARPWSHYEFVDPKLEGLSSGQKMLLRSGPENQVRLIAKLRDLRQRLTGAPLASAPAPARP